MDNIITYTCLNCYLEQPSESKCGLCDYDRMIETDRLMIKVELDYVAFNAMIGPCDEGYFSFAYNPECTSGAVNQTMYRKFLNEQVFSITITDCENSVLSFKGMIGTYYSENYRHGDVYKVGILISGEAITSDEN